MFQISTSTGVALKIQADGAVYSDNAYSSAGADYAEYFFTRDAGLKPGEAVCVDVENENAVKRCSRPADSNVMGIVSTKPAIIGNTKGSAGGSYAIVGLLGQVPAKASAANGEIRPGDSLTPAAEPGYIMRANAGDSTVGVALEALTSPQPSPSQGEGAATGMINILISRRNKSLSVEEVENKITDRIVAMEIEDEVNILIANAVDNLNLDDEIAGIVDGQLLAVNAKLTVEVDNLTNQINNIKNNMDSVLAGMSVVENNIIGLEGRLAALEALGLNADCYFAQLGHPMSNWTSDVQVVASSTGSFVANAPQDDGATSTGSCFSQFFAIKDGYIKFNNASEDSTSSSVAVIDIGADSDLPALSVNQNGAGAVARFASQDVEIVNIAGSGEVTIVGSLLVDGRILVCPGGVCSDKLVAKVNRDKGDIGVAGTVVAGAYAGYCADGWVWAAGSAKYGTMPGFCVMAGKAKYADANGDGLADIDLITSSSHPAWTSVSQGGAIEACQRLGAEYHLLSENEWMTLADNIIKSTANDINPDMAGLQLAVSSATATAYTLTTGDIIYGLAGDQGEWTDMTVTLAGVPEPSSGDWQEYNAITDYKGFNIAPPYYYFAANGIGRILTGVPASDNNLRAFVRGIGGIYGLDLSRAPDSINADVGFRCAKDLSGSLGENGLMPLGPDLLNFNNYQKSQSALGQPAIVSDNLADVYNNYIAERPELGLGAVEPDQPVDSGTGVSSSSPDITANEVNTSPPVILNPPADGEESPGASDVLNNNPEPSAPNEPPLIEPILEPEVEIISLDAVK